MPKTANDPDDLQARTIVSVTGPGIVLASVAYEAGIISAAFYTTLVLVAIFTSQAAGAWLEYVLGRGWLLLLFSQHIISQRDRVHRRNFDPPPVWRDFPIFAVGRAQSRSSKCASVGRIARPLTGSMSCGQAEKARMQSISARNAT